MSNNIDSSLKSSSRSTGAQFQMHSAANETSGIAISSNGTNGTYKSAYGRKIIVSPRSSHQNHNRRYSKGTVYINILFMLISFTILIQIFDPVTQNPLPKNDVLHQQIRNQVETTDQAQSSSSTTVEANNKKQTDRILSLLKDAGIISELSEAQREHIPRWDQVRHQRRPSMNFWCITSTRNLQSCFKNLKLTNHFFAHLYQLQVINLFGDDVVIVGKEDCERYRNRVPFEQRRLGVAGMFNTGTNLLEAQLRKNIILPKASLWQVPWGKHRMADVKYNHTAADMEQYDKDKVLPIVMIRDPFAWLQSMCASPYAAEWRHSKHHCPNLIPNELDRIQYHHLQNAFEVTVIFDRQSKRHFQSLVHLWSEWYAQYLHVDYPILMSKLFLFPSYYTCAAH